MFQSQTISVWYWKSQDLQVCLRQIQGLKPAKVNTCVFQVRIRYKKKQVLLKDIFVLNIRTFLDCIWLYTCPRESLSPIVCSSLCVLNINNETTYVLFKCKQYTKKVTLFTGAMHQCLFSSVVNCFMYASMWVSMYIYVYMYVYIGLI